VETSSVVEVVSRVSRLIDAWCERRCLIALRQILSGWPLPSGLTDDWGQLLDGLKGVRAFAIDEITEDEREELERLIVETEQLVYR